MDSSNFNKMVSNTNDEMIEIQNSLTESYMRLEKAHMDLIMSIDPSSFGKYDNSIECEKCNKENKTC